MIKIIKHEKQSTLVEWLDVANNVHRAYVPSNLIVDGSCPQHVLKLGIPYGVPWADVINANDVTPQKIENALHQYGIWTYEDLLKKPNVAIGALKAVYGISLKSLLSGGR